MDFSKIKDGKGPCASKMTTATALKTKNAEAQRKPEVRRGTGLFRSQTAHHDAAVLMRLAASRGQCRERPATGSLERPARHRDGDGRYRSGTDSTTNVCRFITNPIIGAALLIQYQATFFGSRLRSPWQPQRLCNNPAHRAISIGTLPMC